MQNDVNNAYLRKSAEVLEIDVEKLKIVQLSNLIPCLTPILIYIFHVHLVLIRFLSKLFPFVGTCFEELAPFWIVNRVQEVVDLRTAADSVKRMDLLQLMLDASICEESLVLLTP
jgi:UV DNA damage repair endonuclease